MNTTNKKEKTFSKYLNDLIIEDEDNSLYDATQNVSEADLYNDVLEYGKSDITRLNCMLKDVDRYLFEGFCYSLSAPPFHWPIDKDGNYLELKELELSPDRTFDEYMEIVKNHPHFQTLEEVLQKEKIEYVKFCHEEEKIDKLSVFCGYDLKYRDVRRIRDLIFNEIQQLNDDNNGRPKSETTAIITSTTDSTALHQSENKFREFTDEQIELLKSYFTAKFKGVGTNLNHFNENLLFDLKIKRVGIDYAKIAKLIYESTVFKPEFKEKPFEKWYETFCIIMGIKKCQYRKSQIFIDKAIKNEFYYLT